ncbi:hypothetical protein O9X98_14030 [Agrobacterium salinitolerans]|nr:hypothetical protein [Agrobacterium salinitolerans]
MYSPPADLDQQYEAGFRQAAGLFGLSPHLYGARIDMRQEKADNKDDKYKQRYPDFVYFRGCRKRGGEYDFALTFGRDVSVRDGHPNVTNVKLRYVKHLLEHPENRHLLATDNS